MKPFLVAALLMLTVRLLAAASRVDPRTREDLADLPDGLVLRIEAGPDGPTLTLAKEDGVLTPVAEAASTLADLRIAYQSLDDAWKAFTLRQSVLRAAADGRLDILGSDAMPAVELVRHVLRLQAIFLPRSQALRLGVPRPLPGLAERMALAGRILLRAAGPLNPRSS